MKLFFFSSSLLALALADFHLIQDLPQQDANCNSCMLKAAPGEKATFNPLCVSNSGGKGCIKTNPGKGPDFNGCQYCDFGVFSDIPCNNQFCQYGQELPTLNNLFHTCKLNHPNLAEKLNLFMDLYINNNYDAQVQLEAWKVSHPNLHNLIMHLIPLAKANPDSAFAVLEQWTQSEHHGMDVFQLLDKYTQLYNQNPSLAQLKLQMWKIQHPILVNIFQRVAALYRQNPQLAVEKINIIKAQFPQLKTAFQQYQANPVAGNQMLEQFLENHPNLLAIISTNLQNFPNQQLNFPNLQQNFPNLQQYLNQYSLLWMNNPAEAELKLKQWQVDHPILMQLFGKYARLYVQSPELANAKLQQWKASHPTLVNVFKQYIELYKQNPTMAKALVDNFKTNNPNLLEMIRF
jgi:hypothetical protein